MPLLPLKEVKRLPLVFMSFNRGVAQPGGSVRSGLKHKKEPNVCTV